MKHTSNKKPIAIWLKKACGSECTEKNYERTIRRFFDWANIKADQLVATWKQVRYNLRLRDEFIEDWTENIEGYVYNLENHTPLSRMKVMATIVSFFKHQRIEVNPHRKKNVYVKYHNRDLTREEIKRILQHADIRDRTFFLMMLESGLRPYTLVQLRYKHIKKDFETNTAPMIIELPSELLKDRVEARWTFIGQDGFKTLKEYLKPRMPLKDESLIFIPQRDDMKHEFLQPQTFTNKFGRIALKLGITERTKKGKPKKVRLYCLRKYFNNNVRYEGFDHTFKQFWMGHTNTQIHYLTRNVERHREEYAKAYNNLRIYRDQTEQTILELRKELEKAKQELESTKETLNILEPFIEFMKQIGQKYREEGKTTEEIINSYASWRGQQIIQDYEKRNKKET